jgi:2'-hydroxyisoflavone reductase
VDLGVLSGRTWDAVIDTCGYYPRQVRTLLAALSGRPHYTFVSSASAYADPSQSGLNENSPLSDPLMDDAITTITGENYGPLKSACESVAGEGALIIRPGIIVGPHDPTGRFAYWVRRFTATGEFLAPGDGDVPLQIIDARDLAAWMIKLIEQKKVGAFNAVGPERSLSFGQFIAAGVTTMEKTARPIWVHEAALIAEKIEGWAKLPLWISSRENTFTGLYRLDGRKAWNAGLTHRDLSETIRDCASYESSLAEPNRVGLSRDDELALLAKFKTGVN